jgi:hypothetical protein
MGTPMITAPAVTYMLPRTIGSMPKDGSAAVGRHCCPNKKSITPMRYAAGSPCANKNMQINATARMDANAARKKTTRIKFSRAFNIS